MVSALRRRGFINFPGIDKYNIKAQSFTEPALLMMLVEQLTAGYPPLIEDAVAYILEVITSQGLGMLVITKTTILPSFQPLSFV